MPPTKFQANLQIASAAVTLIAVCVGAVFFVAPLRTIPADMEGLKRDIKVMREAQISDAVSIRTVGENEKDIKTLRRDVDSNTSSIRYLGDRIQRLEP